VCGGFDLQVTTTFVAIKFAGYASFLWQAAEPHFLASQRPYSDTTSRRTRCTRAIRFVVPVIAWSCAPVDDGGSLFLATGHFFSTSSAVQLSTTVTGAGVASGRGWFNKNRVPSAAATY
jgi:hypothetical protein